MGAELAWRRQLRHLVDMETVQSSLGNMDQARANPPSRGTRDRNRLARAAVCASNVEAAQIAHLCWP